MLCLCLVPSCDGDSLFFCFSQTSVFNIATSTTLNLLRNGQITPTALQSYCGYYTITSLAIKMQPEWSKSRSLNKLIRRPQVVMPWPERWLVQWSSMAVLNHVTLIIIAVPSSRKPSVHRRTTEKSIVTVTLSVNIVYCLCCVVHRSVWSNLTSCINSTGCSVEDVYRLLSTQSGYTWYSGDQTSFNKSIATIRLMCNNIDGTFTLHYKFVKLFVTLFVKSMHLYISVILTVVTATSWTWVLLNRWLTTDTALSEIAPQGSFYFDVLIHFNCSPTMSYNYDICTLKMPNWHQSDPLITNFSL